MVNKKILALILILCSLLFIPRDGFAQSTCTATRNTATTDELNVITQNNALRASLGIAPLVFDPSLELAAVSHSTKMATSGVFAHDSYGDTLARVNSCGNPGTSIDENIAGGNGGSVATYNQWLNSAPHKANMVDPNMKSVGVAMVVGSYNDGTTVWPNFPMWTEVFSNSVVSPSPSPSPSPNPIPPAPTPKPSPSPVTCTGIVYHNNAYFSQFTC